MNRPYIDALNRPAEADSLPLRKNDTVIGIIGKTQGVSNASSPQPIATRISPNSPSPAGSCPTDPAGSRISKGQSSGMLQLSPWHERQLIFPLSTPSAAVRRTRWPRTISPSYSPISSPKISSKRRSAATFSKGSPMSSTPSEGSNAITVDEKPEWRS